MAKHAYLIAAHDNLYVEGAFAYYHVLSGSDMPLHGQDHLHNFFDEHQGRSSSGLPGRSTTNGSHTSMS